MSRRSRKQRPSAPEFATNLRLLDMAYGGETIARIDQPGLLSDQAVTETEISAEANELAEEKVLEDNTTYPQPLEEPQLIAEAETEMERELNSGVRGPSSVVFVAGGLPGELVDVQLYRRKKSYLRGNVTQVVEASPDRQEAPCPYFFQPAAFDRTQTVEVSQGEADTSVPPGQYAGRSNCGGCQWQHARYNSQLAYKANILRDQLIRLGGLENPPLLEPIAARSAWAYRNNVEFQIDRRTERPCYHRQNSIRLVPVESCHIAHPLVTLAIAPLAAALAQHLPGKVHQVTLRIGPISGDSPIAAEEIRAIAPYNSDEAALLGALERFTAVAPLEMALQPRRPAIMFILRMLGQADLTPFVADMQAALDRYAEITIIAEGKKRRLDVLCGPANLEEVLHGITYRVPPLAFFQSNPAMAEELVSQVLEAFEAAQIKLRGARLLDIFCGVGTFSLQLARYGAQVLGIEEYDGATLAAQENARLNHLDGLTRFVAARAEEYILELEAQGQPFDAVLLDPPRRGCDPALLQSLLKTRPGHIVYVSCDPSTLARDIKLLNPGYELVRSRLVDMFPQTYHMESVSLLRRRD